jgi:murein DD-endopeptidase MepM/ murein hydrolase activator NlpD
VEIELDEETILTWEKGAGQILFNRRGRPQEVEVKAVGGVVESSLFEDGQKLGLSSSLLSQLADIFSWDIDFDREIQQGDTFKLLYEVRTQKGKEEKRSFRILAAELINSGRKHFAVYFEKKQGQGNYYDLYGQSLARAFLRFPLEFSRISSTFSEARYHPILKEERPHHGVDFAAARGTPVRAIADGAIQYAGWRRGGYGRTIEVLHSSEYGSRYAHLQRLARGIRNGTRVKRGQIIGFVGSSGRTTGPHLHFELYRAGELLDPLKYDVPPEDSIDPVLLKVFEDAKQLLLAELAAAQSS